MKPTLGNFACAGHAQKTDTPATALKKSRRFMGSQRSRKRLDDATGRFATFEGPKRRRLARPWFRVRSEPQSKTSPPRNRGECVQRRFQGGDEQFPLQKLSNFGFRAAGITPGGLFRCCIVDRPPGQRPAQRGSYTKGEWKTYESRGIPGHVRNGPSILQMRSGLSPHRKHGEGSRN
jgi:hypothetical protein